VVHGVDDAHKLGVLLDGVRFAADARWDIDHADVSTADTASPPDCGGRFVAFAQAPASAYTVGAGQRFATVQAALDAAPEGATIAIYPGTYREVVRMTKPGQRLVGLGATREDVVIEEAQSAGTSGGTGKSATLFAQADGVSLAHLTIANRFHWEHPEVKDGAQALALSTTGDRQSFSDLHLIGFQDTLFAGSHGCAADKPCLPSRQIFADSRIDGAVDFVFGDALAWFERVELHALGRDNVLLTAQGRRELRQPSGYVFHACTVSAQEPVKQISLGRPWRDYATVFFVGCTLDDKVLPAGFTEWNDLNRLPTARYAIWDARGPGAAKGPREPFLLSAQAKADAHVASAADFFAHPPQ
jgi:polygalacturonase